MPSPRQPSVLFLADSLRAVGGLERMQLALAAGLAARGWRVDLIAGAGGQLEAQWSAVACSVQHAPSLHLERRHPIRSAAGLLAAVRAGRRLRPDVVYAHSHTTALLGSLVAGRRRPLVLHLHRAATASMRTQFRRALRRVRRFVAVSRACAAEWIAAGVPSDRVTVVHNGVDPDVFRPTGTGERAHLRAELGARPDDLLVGYVGRLDPDKGVDVLLEAFRKLHSARPGSRLVVVGEVTTLPPSARPQWRRRLDDLAAGEPVGLLPAREDVVPVLRALDVLALPSRSETFGLVVLEAMACGTPVVASAVGGIPEILTGEFARFLVPPEDSNALADALADAADALAADPGWRERCRRHIVERFTVDETIVSIDAVLREAMDQ